VKTGRKEGEGELMATNRLLKGSHIEKDVLGFIVRKRKH